MQYYFTHTDVCSSNLANVVTSFIMCLFLYLYDYEQEIINVRLSEAIENIISQYLQVGLGSWFKQFRISTCI